MDTAGSPRNNLYYRADLNGRWYALNVITTGSVNRFYLKNGKIETTSGSSWASTGTEVINMAAAEGVTITTADLGGATGNSATTGWANWTE